MAGRPSKYRSEMCQEIIDFFDVPPYYEDKDIIQYKDGTTKEIRKEIPNDIPFFSSFCRSINISKETMHRWIKEIPEFRDAYQKAKDLQKQMLVINGLRGNYQTAFAIFTAKNITDMRDKQEHQHTGEVKRTFVWDEPRDEPSNEASIQD